MSSGSSALSERLLYAAAKFLQASLIILFLVMEKEKTNIVLISVLGNGASSSKRNRHFLKCTGFLLVKEGRNACECLLWQQWNIVCTFPYQGDRCKLGRIEKQVSGFCLQVLRC